VIQWQHSHEEEDVMSNRLPWWLSVIAGSAVILVTVGVLLYLSIVFIMYPGASQSPDLCLMLLGGAVITLVLTIVIGVPIYSIARAHKRGCAFAIATSLLLVLLLLLFLAVIVITTGGGSS
jgi:hypothetical protein